jgi:Na+-driven multidrug efflux pump
MRASGDTRRPMIYILVAGFAKVILNLIMVKFLHLGVAGLGIATIVSNMLSSYMIMRALIRGGGYTEFFWNKMRFYASSFKEILRIGIPAGVQGSLFGLSNMVIQSTINSFGEKAMAGTAAVQVFEAVVYMIYCTYYSTEISFVGQNYGAKKYKRILHSVVYCFVLASAMVALVSVFITLNGAKMISMFSSDPEVIAYGVERIYFVILPYFLLAMAENVNGGLRGMGYSLVPTLVSLFGICFFRIFWAKTIFPYYGKTMAVLLISYPVSWTIVLLINGTMLCLIFRRLFRSAVKSRKFVTVRKKSI